MFDATTAGCKISTQQYLAQYARCESQHLQQLVTAQPIGQVKMMKLHIAEASGLCLYGCIHGRFSKSEQAQFHSTAACGPVVNDGSQFSQLEHLCCDMPLTHIVAVNRTLPLPCVCSLLLAPLPVRALRCSSKNSQCQ